METDFCRVNTPDQSQNEVFLGMGSNQGDRINNLRRAINYLIRDSDVIIGKISSVYESLPWGNKNQGNFLNLAILLSTEIKILQMLEKIRKIEDKIGHKPEVKWGPRNIDIDILYFRDEIIHLRDQV